MSLQELDQASRSKLIAPDGQRLKSIEDFQSDVEAYFNYLSSFDIHGIMKKSSKEMSPAEYFIKTHYVVYSEVRELNRVCR
ncbi:hypothetical protein [Acanthopleuribacter pedis]|uniref:Uncharacterized protein n=1 Tax=Acanthopleuribacter pedis TaxID=442870 RepID=A0A8J7QIB6_9BACT|nr:hypothetical protein [Acanthopleuribacter pedis]MBO1318788.1 hypothetical protein [Acanthopleuribacter pedis]